jgi:hypothetical protein
MSAESSIEAPRWLRRTPSTLVVPPARLGDGGIRWAAAEGFFRGQAYLTGYEPARLATWSGLFINRDLTLFAAPDTWRLHLGWVVYSLALGLLVTYVDKQLRFARVALGLFEGAVVEFRTLTAFVLGGFVLLVVGAWRERRAGYSAICSATKALLITVAATVPLKAVEERRYLGRWVTLAFELAVLKARTHGDSKPAREFLQDTGLLIADEWDAMEPGNRDATVLCVTHSTSTYLCLLHVRVLLTGRTHPSRTRSFWINLELKNALSVGTITVFEFTQLVGQVTRMRDAAHDLMARNSQDMPYPYASMIGLLVQIQIVLQCTKHALLCAVLYPPYHPAASVSHAAAAALGAALNASMSTAWPEPEPEGEPGAEPAAEPEPPPEPSAAKTAATMQIGSYSQVDGITGKGWGYVAHMWMLQVCEPCSNVGQPYSVSACAHGRGHGGPPQCSIRLLEQVGVPLPVESHLPRLLQHSARATQPVWNTAHRSRSRADCRRHPKARRQPHGPHERSAAAIPPRTHQDAPEAATSRTD